MKQLFFYTCLAFLLVNCSKGKISSYNEAYCEAISAEDYDLGGEYLNKFLKANRRLSDEEILKKTQEWLWEKECVLDATLICNSCIETNPPKSQISVAYNVNGQNFSKTITLVMSSPVRYDGIED